mgnify:CR=1 FL=1
MKYRIVEKSFSDGWTGYFIQKRVFGLWCSETRPVNECTFSNLCFNTAEEAEDWIERNSKKSPTVIRQRILG